MNDALAERVPPAAQAATDPFAALYEKTFPRVYAYVASLLRDRAAAEDVTAQAFERAYRKRGSYRARRGSLEAWLFGIARNAALDELQRLALELRADSPEPDPAFTAALRERMEAGFPRERDRRRPTLARLLPAAGVAAAVLIALVVAVSLRSSSEEGSVPPDAGALLSPESAEDGSAGTSLPPEPPNGDFAPGRTQRIERSAELELQAPGDELERVADGVTAVTDRHDGFVLSSSFTSTDDDGAGGSFDLRIPVDRLNQALRDLAGLATVRSRTQSGQDVTPAYVGTHDRLRAARAERRSLLTRLERAETDNEAAAIRARLELVGREIDGLRGQLRQLRIRTSYAAVTVTLTSTEADGGAATGSTGEALDDAVGSLLGAVNVGLRILGVAVPLGIAALLVWLPARWLRRRRRESVLA